jgi:dienelactone hydrolase
VANDLVQTVTRDGVRLDGAFQTSAVSAMPAIGIDAFCLIHGTGGSFYSSTLFDDLADRLLNLGCGVLRINTRGHDLMSTAATTHGPRRQGAAYEVVSDCTHDLIAWVSWLRSKGCSRVVLAGHSLGAVKTLYALTHEPGFAVTGAIALSPPCLSHGTFTSSTQGATFIETYTQAEEHVQAGKPDTLMEVKVPLPFVITAAGYVEKYGPEERYNYLRFLQRIPCPTLITLGEQEVAHNMAFQGVPEVLEHLPARPARLSVVTLAGADHFYSTAREALGNEVERWLRTTCNAVP